MSKFERPQKGNPHRLAVKQHIFPSKSIARFAGVDGRVQIHMMRPKNLIRRAKPNDDIFCAARAWDHDSEVGFIKKLEDDFQRLAELIIAGSVLSFDQTQMHIISAFYALWMARAELRVRPARDTLLEGVLPGRTWSTDEEESLEKVGIGFFRGNTVPSRIVNGGQLRIMVGRYLRQKNPTAEWGIVRTSDAEFVVPDWPVYEFLPIHPTLALVNPASNQTLTMASVSLVNGQLRAASRSYFFARDFSRCP